MSRNQSFGIGLFVMCFAWLSQAASVEAQVVVQEPTTPQGVVVVQAAPTYAPVVQYQQPTYAQPVYTQPAYPQPAPRRRGGANIGLIVSGSVLLGVGWILNFIVGLPAGDDPFDSGGADPEWSTFRFTSLIPVAGPWVQLAAKPTGFDDDYWGTWLIIDGLMQVAGLTMLIAGIATSTSEETVADLGGGVRLTVLPTAGPGHAGLTLLGTF